MSYYLHYINDTCMVAAIKSKKRSTETKL